VKRSAATQTLTLQRQNILFHHGDTEGTEISQRASGLSVHLRVLRVSVVNKVLEFFFELGFTQLLGLITGGGEA